MKIEKHRKLCLIAFGGNIVITDVQREYKIINQEKNESKALFNDILQARSFYRFIEEDLQCSFSFPSTVTVECQLMDLEGKTFFFDSIGKKCYRVFGVYEVTEATAYTVAVLGAINTLLGQIYTKFSEEQQKKENECLNVNSNVAFKGKKSMKELEEFLSFNLFNTSKEDNSSIKQYAKYLQSNIKFHEAFPEYCHSLLNKENAINDKVLHYVGLIGNVIANKDSTPIMLNDAKKKIVEEIEKILTSIKSRQVKSDIINYNLVGSLFPESPPISMNFYECKDLSRTFYNYSNVY